jgi:hypothetical protein
VAVPAIALAGTSNAVFWHNKTNTVTCGIMTHPANTPPMAILCSAKGIPAPKHTTTADGDAGFVMIGRTGKPQTLRLSQDEFAFSHAKALSNGTLWTSPPVAVTCNIASDGTVVCFNTQNHGFRIGDNHYSSF